MVRLHVCEHLLCGHDELLLGRARLRLFTADSESSTIIAMVVERVLRVEDHQIGHRVALVGLLDLLPQRIQQLDAHTRRRKGAHRIRAVLEQFLERAPVREIVYQRVIVARAAHVVRQGGQVVLDPREVQAPVVPCLQQPFAPRPH